MTGDGSVVGALTSYEFSLHCDPYRGANSLWVEWGGANGFELTRVTDVVCRDDSTLDPGRPFANFDTYHGEGHGRLDGEEGARAKWMFTDAGEPGSADHAEIAVYGPDGDLVFEVSGPIARDHQARGEAFLPIEPRVDEDNVINSVIVDEEARSRDFEQTFLSADAFGAVDQEPKPPAEETPPPKINPDLLQRIEDGDPDERAEILMNLTEVKVLERFPDHAVWFGCDSPLTFQLKQETVAIIADQFNANLQATEEFMARFNDGDHDIQVHGQFWLVNAFVADVRLGDIAALAADDEVQFIEETVQSVLPPGGFDGNPDNDVVDARAHMLSDPWFNMAGANRGCIGLIDTGVDGIEGNHVLFDPPNPNIRLHGDCANGGPTCLDPNWPGFNLHDIDNHGTGSAGIISGNMNMGIDFRGVTDILVDSWKVWETVGNGEQSLVSDAVILAFEQGILNFDRVFAVELQAKGTATGPVSVAADNAFNAGAVVVAATGNCAVVNRLGDSLCDIPTGTHSPGTARVPSVAHKVLGVGAYNIQSLTTGDSQGYGPTNDGRIKPDIQTPTDTETASQCIIPPGQVRDCAVYQAPYTPTGLGAFGGTSGSTPYAAGVAALMRNWLRGFNSFDPGHTYARLILNGQYTYPYLERHGAGHIRLPQCAHSHWGRVRVPVSAGNAGTVDIPIPVATASEQLIAALWWPESVEQTHSDIDLYLIDPNGLTEAAATDVESVFERTGEMNPLPGQWTLRIQGFRPCTGQFCQTGLEQVVYWAADVLGCDSISQQGNPYPPISP